jgi:uncharacterized protein YfdQ (DUF2303 family)
VSILVDAMRQHMAANYQAQGFGNFSLPINKPNHMSTEAAAIADLVRQTVKHDVNINPTATELLIFPDKSLVSLEKYADRPRRKRSRVRLDDTDSFIKYVNNHKQAGTALFGRATLEGGAFGAIIDGHEGALDALTDQRPAWGEHRAIFDLAQTPEWKRWIAINEKPISQGAFAEFIEDMLSEIQKPAGIEMLEIAKTLSIKSDVAFSSALRLDNGQVQLQYIETVEQKSGQGGELTVPTEIELALQPFIGGARYLVKARLRTKLSNRSVQFTVLLDRPHKVVETAFKEMREKIAAETGLPVLAGGVESIGL